MADVLGLIGKKLGKYEIVSYINSGGMSFIYRARQDAFKREVAIKVTNVSDAKLHNDDHSFLEFSKRFSREAEIVSRLNHPHILKVFDYGDDDGFVYLVMELHTGGTLASMMLHDGRLSLKQTSKILQDIAEALDYAHQHGVIHRDIKPQNVLMDEQGNAILTDFGIAKVVDDTNLTRPGSAVGTPTYMSPEQWQGALLDGRSDQYSLGVMAYEMLSGTLPFPSETPFSLMTNHLHTPPPPLHLRRADIPPSVEYVINKALAKDRSGRYASTKQFAAAFAIAITGEMPSDDPLDTALPPPRRKTTPVTQVELIAVPKTPFPATSVGDIGEQGRDATITLEKEMIDPQRTRVLTTPRLNWMTMGAAGIVLVGVILFLLIGSGKFPMLAMESTQVTSTPAVTATPVETETPAPTATLEPTVTLEPTAVATSAPIATAIPPLTANFLGTIFANDFEKNDLGGIEANGWQIAPDPANDANHLFCIQTSTGQWAQLNLADSLPWEDYSISFRAQIMQFDPNDKNAGNIQIALRVQERPADGGDPDSYYAGLDAKKENTFFQKWTKATNGIDLGYGPDGTIDTKQWYNVRVDIQGVRMRLFINDELIQEATDTSLPSGGVGIQAAPSTFACIDNLVIRNLHNVLATMMKVTRFKLSEAQDLLSADGKVIGNLKAGTEVFVIEENADKTQVYVRDDATGRQGWLPASVVPPS